MEMNLLSDLALILISAGIVTIIFKLLKQPLVLGYIVAGFLVGPHFDLFPTIIENESVHQWSEIGIIFLMFTLGLEFSFKKLFKVGASAFLTAGAGILLTFCISFLVGIMMNWSFMESIFLGGMLSISSTTIIIKAFDDLKITKQRFSDLTLVVLILQDLVAIIMMVMLSTAAVSQKFSGSEMFGSIMKLLFFLVLWFVIGIAIIPSFFRRTKKYVNDETLLIISIGLCFGMVTFANYVGFSSALGAFVMGSILSETVEGPHIEKMTQSIKNLFGSIFFVSVGMMVDPKVLGEYWLPILILTLLTIFGKTIFNMAGALLSGENLKDSLRIGFSLAQIGEFSFIIAALGVSLNVMHEYIYGIIVAVSVITTFTTPYCIRAGEPAYAFIYKRMSPKMRKRLDEYSVRENNAKEESDIKQILKSTLPQIIIFSILIFAIISVAYKWVYPTFWSKFPDMFSVKVQQVLSAGITLVLIAPFLYGLMVTRQKTRETFAILAHKSHLNRAFIFTITLGQNFIALFFVFTLLSKAFLFTPWVIFFLAIFVVVFIRLSQRTIRRFNQLEVHFMRNLNAKELQTKDSISNSSE
jgi:CPA2 family monovalent cation:H+ antiporter-2